MQLTQTLIYVENVSLALQFYQKAFGFELAYIDENKHYGVVKLGSATLAFVNHDSAERNIGIKVRKLESAKNPVGVELLITTNKVKQTFDQAIQCGATKINKPKEKSWGCEVGYVRDPNGVLIAISSMGT